MRSLATRSDFSSAFNSDKKVPATKTRDLLDPPIANPMFDILGDIKP